MSRYKNINLNVMNILSKIMIQLNMIQGKGFGTSSVYREVSAAAKFLPKNPRLIIDVGANQGDYSAALMKKYRSSQIHIFEPSKVNFDKLQERFQKDTNIYINNLALSDHNSKKTLFADKPGSGLASLTKRRLDHFGIQFDYIEEISVLAFKQYWDEELNRSDIDLIKMDIEGHELSALKGCKEALRFCRVVQFEFGGCNIDTKTYFQDFWYFFKDLEFKIYRITPLSTIEIKKYSEADEVFMTTNYLAVNERFAS